MVSILVLLFAIGTLVYADTLSVQLGPEPCPPNTPGPQPARCYINNGDYVRFHTSLSCDFWVSGPAPIGVFRLGIHTAQAESVTGPFNERYTNWHYSVIDGDSLKPTATGVVTIRSTPTLTQWGLIILAVLLIASTVFIMRRRRKAVPA